MASGEGWGGGDTAVDVGVGVAIVWFGCDATEAARAFGRKRWDCRLWDWTCFATKRLSGIRV